MGYLVSVCVLPSPPNRSVSGQSIRFTGHRTSSFLRRSHSWAVGVSGGSWLQ